MYKNHVFFFISPNAPRFSMFFLDCPWTTQLSIRLHLPELYGFMLFVLKASIQIWEIFTSSQLGLTIGSIFNHQRPLV